MIRNEVRAKLTLWHVSALAVILTGFSIAVYGLYGRDLSHRIDDDLLFVASSTHETLKHEAEEAAATSGDREIELESIAEHLSTLHPAIIVISGQKVVFEKPVTGSSGRRLTPAIFDNSGIADWTFEEANGFRVLRGTVKIGEPRKVFFFAVGEPLEAMQAELHSLGRTFLVACPIALLGAGLLGWFMVGKTLAPVLEMSAEARLIGERNLDRRLPVANPADEYGFLAQTLNDLIGRIQAAFERQRQFMVDASHELRTPLSVIRTTAEVTLSTDKREETEYREALRITDEQVCRLNRIVEDMFLLARGDAAQSVVRLGPLYLDETVDEVVRAIRVLAEWQGVKVELDPMPEMPFRGDESLLRQLFLNLLENAVKYTPAGGEVRVQGQIDSRRFIISVTDTGPGISEKIKPFIFDRFFRGDSARSNQCSPLGAGAGLGLSIARRISELHGGQVELRESNRDGSIFTVTLPS